MTEKPVILCADDTSTMLQGRKMLLEKNGYRVLTAANGKEAVQAFVSHTVDLVLLDYRVPQIDGGVAAIHMRACKPDVPIALLSGDESPPPSALEAVECFHFQIGAHNQPPGKSGLLAEFAIFVSAARRFVG